VTRFVYVLAPLLILASCGPAASLLPSDKASLVVRAARIARQWVCDRSLDPLLGDPRGTPDAGAAHDAEVEQ
jgi:hypothetical protein